MFQGIQTLVDYFSWPEEAVLFFSPNLVHAWYIDIIVSSRPLSYGLPSYVTTTNFPKLDSNYEIRHDFLHFSSLFLQLPLPPLCLCYSWLTCSSVGSSATCIWIFVSTFSSVLKVSFTWYVLYSFWNSTCSSSSFSKSSIGTTATKLFGIQLWVIISDLVNKSNRTFWFPSFG